MTSYAINLLQRRTKSIQNIVFEVDFIDLPVSCYCWLGPDIILFENVLAQRHDIAANEMEWSRLLFKWHSSLKTANFDFLSKKNQSIHLSTTSYKTRIISIILCHETNFASITFAMEYCNFLVASGCEYVIDITCVLQFRPNSTINRAVTYILEAPKVMKWHSNFLSFSSIICVRIIRLQRYIESLFVSNSNVMHELIPWPKISIITRKLSTQQAQCHTNTSIRQKRLSEIRLYKFYNRENLKPNCLRIQCASNEAGVCNNALPLRNVRCEMQWKKF